LHENSNPRRLGLVFKKTLRASEQGRADIAQARCEWKDLQININPNRLVFLDESGVKTNMTRLYGRSLHGARCYDSAPNGHWETATVLSSIRLDGTTESVVFDGAVDRKMFDEYVKEFLAPSLRPGDIVIADNLSAHKSQNAYNTIKEKQAEFVFLPPYSPVPHIRQRTRPVMRCAASFNTYCAWCEPDKIFHHLAAVHFFVGNCFAFHISGEYLKHILCNVQTDKICLTHDPSPYWRSRTG
jgi:hypothetical protein